MKPDKNNFLIRQRSAEIEKFELQAAVAFSNVFPKEEILQNQENIEAYLTRLEHHANRIRTSNTSHFSVPHNDINWFRRPKDLDDGKPIGSFTLYTYSNDTPIPIKNVVTCEMINNIFDTPVFDPERLLKADCDVYLLVPKELTRSVVDFYTSAAMKRVGFSLKNLGVGGHLPKHVLLPASFVISSFKIKVPMQNAFFMFVAAPVIFHHIPLSDKFTIKHVD